MRNKKKNKYEHLSGPQAELDFHTKGILTEQEIISECDQFLQSCIQKGYDKVLIITGKGLHSENGPVIKPLLEHHLRSHPNVIRFKEARRDRGGGGAYEVYI